MIRLPFNITIALSKRKKVPVLYMFKRTFLPHQLLHLLAQMWWLKVIHRDDKGAIIELYGQQIKLLGDFLIMLATEWKIWEKYYLPPFPLYGKTILDVGAGCGETAFFYILYGAKKIIAIEPDVKALKCLE